jgi:hypothetical protein
MCQAMCHSAGHRPDRRESLQPLDGPSQMAGRQVRVAQNHRHGGVAQDLVDILQRRAVHDEPRGAGVAQVVEAEIREAGLPYNAIDLDLPRLAPKPLRWNRWLRAATRSNARSSVIAMAGARTPFALKRATVSGSR